jgi:ParB family transcriptional regulator, chromosome partitioning protein
MAEEPRQRLGRGLAALIGEAAEDGLAGDRPRGQRRIPIEFLRPNPRNPRKDFDSSSLDELTESVRDKGVLQPILVREIAGTSDAYEIIAGERRWRAAQRASLHTVPIVVVDASDREALEIAIVENVQRSDLSALEEASGYDLLMRDHGYTQSDVARVVGKSRSHVANTLRLLNLPDNVKSMVSDGSLSAGHARALLSVSDPGPLAQKIVAQGLSVRDAERLAQANARDAAPNSKRDSIDGRADPDTRNLERSLQEATGLSVTIRHKGEGGELLLRYKSVEQLDQITKLLLSNRS